MIQDILTLSIITASAGYAIYNLIGLILPVKKNKAPHCAGCAGCDIKKRDAVNRVSFKVS
jgi:hypothetical protein